MNTLYTIYEHEHTWATDQDGNPLTDIDVVVEFQPENGLPSYWYMPEAVGSWAAICTMCSTADLGKVTRLGVLTTPEELSDLIRELMGDRYNYNDRLRMNANIAFRRAKGEQ